MLTRCPDSPFPHCTNSPFSYFIESLCLKSGPHVPKVVKFKETQVEWCSPGIGGERWSDLVLNGHRVLVREDGVPEVYVAGCTLRATELYT